MSNATAQATITISLEIENVYENGDEVTTYVTNVEIPAPPAEDDPAYEAWEYEQIHDRTGTGRPEHESGDSWHDVTVTACSDPALVGKTFEYGY